MADESRGEDYMRTLPDICESLFPHAVAWRDSIYAANVVRGVVHGQQNRDELEVLEEFIAVCRFLGFDGT